MFFFSHPHGYHHGFGSSSIGFPTHFVVFASSFPRTCRFSVFTRRHLKTRSTIATNHRATILLCSKADRLQPEPEHEEENERSRSKENSSSSSSYRLSSGENDGNLSNPSPSSAARGHGDIPSSSSSSSSSDGNSSLSSASQGKQVFSSSAHETFSSTSSNPSLTSEKVNGASPELVCTSSSSLPATNNPDRMAAAVTGTSSSPISKQLNCISKGIKAAFEVFEGWKVVQKLQSPSVEGALLVGFGAGNWVLLSVNVAKYLAKGLRASEKVLTSALSRKLIFKGLPEGAIVEKTVNKDLASVAKGFNAFYGAMKVVQFTKGWGSKFHVAKVDGSFIWNVYKLSKSVVTVVDAVIGKNGWASAYIGKGFLFVKKTVGGIGVVGKAAFLSKELCMAVFNKFAISGGTLAVSLGRDFRKDQIDRVMHDHHFSKKMRVSCTTTLQEINNCNVVLVSFHWASITSKSVSSFQPISKGLHEFLQTASIGVSEEDDLCNLFYLAIPITEEVLWIL